MSHIIPLPEKRQATTSEAGMTLDALTELISRATTEFRVIVPSAGIRVQRTGFCQTEIPNTLVLAASLKWFQMAVESANISCILTTESVLKVSRQERFPNTAIVTCEQPDQLFYFVHNQGLHNISSDRGSIDGEPKVAESASVHPSAVLIGDVSIGERVVVGPGSVVIGPARIDADTVIESNCTIGGDGVFRKVVFGRSEHIRHYGGVRIGANCRIHSAVTISKGVNVGENTEVGDDVSIGPQSIVGHDCKILRRTVIAARGSILGRVTIGEECWIGACATVSNPVSVGGGSKVRLGAVVVEDLEPHSDVSGNYARPHRQFLKEYMSKKAA